MLGTKPECIANVDMGAREGEEVVLSVGVAGVPVGTEHNTASLAGHVNQPKGVSITGNTTNYQLFISNSKPLPVKTNFQCLQMPGS